MSLYRDALPDDETRARYDAAIANAARVLAEATAQMHELAAAEGSLAVGRAAYYPGHRLGSPEAIAARYEQLYGRRSEQAA